MITDTARTTVAERTMSYGQERPSCAPALTAALPPGPTWSKPQFGLLRQFTIANPDHPAPARELHVYLRWRNANNRPPTVAQVCFS